AADVADHLEAVGEPHLGHLPQRRVRLLRGSGIDAGADAAALWRAGKRRHLALPAHRAAALAHQLIYRWPFVLACLVLFWFNYLKILILIKFTNGLPVPKKRGRRRHRPGLGCCVARPLAAQGPVQGGRREKRLRILRGYVTSVKLPARDFRGS